MHEMSLCESVIRILHREAERHRFVSVKTVWIEVGARSCVAPEAMDFCFKAVAKGTLAEGARIEMLREWPVGWCLDCGEAVALADGSEDCPRCGSHAVQICGSDTLRITNLEVE